MKLKELIKKVETETNKKIFDNAVNGDVVLTTLFEPLNSKAELKVDDFLYFNLGERKLFLSVEELANNSLQDIIYYVNAMLHANIYRYTELIRSMSTDYNPIENYDRTEEHSENFTKDIDGHLISGIKKSNTINQVTPNTSNNLVNESGTEYTQDAFTDSSGQNESGSTNITSRIHGNIGVTTTQEMLLSARKVAQFNITEIIACDIANYLCVGVYCYD